MAQKAVAAVALDLEWNRKLRHRRGAAQRLGGIDVYYDFKWDDYFCDGRAQFKNGQCLAENICTRCPKGKTPALLLTDNEEADQGYRETPEHLVFVLNLPEYLETYADPSLAYQAYRLGDGITRIGALNPEAADRAEAGATLLENEIEIDQIAAWVGEDPERQRQLRELAGGEERAGTDDVLRVLAGLGDDLDPEVVAVIGALFGADADRQQRLELLRAITADSGGRYLTGEVMLERVPQRIAEAREAMADYESLLEDDGSTETRMQVFIEANLWLLGLDYAAMRPKQRLLAGELDFLLERFDGVHDLLELKSPQDEILRVREGAREAAPTGSSYSLSPALAQALGQVHAYRSQMTRQGGAIDELLNLTLTHDPHLTIIIGRIDRLSGPARAVLGELNKSLHHVEVVPYDVLSKRAAKTLDNIEEHLSVAAEQVEAN